MQDHVVNQCSWWYVESTATRKFATILFLMG